VPRWRGHASLAKPFGTLTKTFDLHSARLFEKRVKQALSPVGGVTGWLAIMEEEDA
jgi:hypothetical protein